MFISLFVVSIIYILVSYTLIRNVSLSDLAIDIKPIYTLASLLSVEWFSYFVAIIGIFTLISMANSGVLASSRFPFAMAMDN